MSRSFAAVINQLAVLEQQTRYFLPSEERSAVEADSKVLADAMETYRAQLPHKAGVLGPSALLRILLFRRSPQHPLLGEVPLASSDDQLLRRKQQWAALAPLVKWPTEKSISSSLTPFDDEAFDERMCISSTWTLSGSPASGQSPLLVPSLSLTAHRATYEASPTSPLVNGTIMDTETPRRQVEYC